MNNTHWYTQAHSTQWKLHSYVYHCTCISVIVYVCARKWKWPEVTLTFCLSLASHYSLPDLCVWQQLNSTVGPSSYTPEHHLYPGRLAPLPSPSTHLVSVPALLPFTQSSITNAPRALQASARISPGSVALLFFILLREALTTSALSTGLVRPGNSGPSSTDPWSTPSVSIVSFSHPVAQRHSIPSAASIDVCILMPCSYSLLSRIFCFSISSSYRCLRATAFFTNSFALLYSISSSGVLLSFQRFFVLVFSFFCVTLMSSFLYLCMAFQMFSLILHGPLLSRRFHQSWTPSIFTITLSSTLVLKSLYPLSGLSIESSFHIFSRFFAFHATHLSLETSAVVPHDLSFCNLLFFNKFALRYIR